MRKTENQGQKLPPEILDKVQQAVDNVKALAEEGDFNKSKKALKNEFKVSLAAIEAGQIIMNGPDEEAPEKTAEEAPEKTPQQRMAAIGSKFLEALDAGNPFNLPLLNIYAKDMLNDCKQNFAKYPARFEVSTANPRIEMQLKMVGNEFQARFIKDNQQTVQCTLNIDNNKYQGFTQKELSEFGESTDDPSQTLPDQQSQEDVAKVAQSDQVAFKEDWELAEGANSDKLSKRAKELRKQDEKQAKADRKEAKANQRSRNRGARIIARRAKKNSNTRNV